MIPKFDKEALKAWLLERADHIHHLFFGKKMGEVAVKFLKGLSYSMMGGVAAGAILFGVNILAGRWLGPEEYGKYGLVHSFAFFCLIPMLLGVDGASVYYIARAFGDREKKAYISSTSWMIFSFALVVAFVGFLLTDFFCYLLKITPGLFQLALVFSVVYAWRGLSWSYLQGLRHFRFQAISTTLEASLVAFFFLVFTLGFGWYGVESFLWAMIGGFSSFGLMVFLFLGHYLGFSLKHWKRLLVYGLSGIPGFLAIVVFENADKFIIHRYLDGKTLGIYTAYSMASFAIVSHLNYFFINVMFPYASSSNEKKMLRRRLNWTAKWFFLPGVLCFSLMTATIMYLFGKEYPLTPTLILCFGLVTALKCYYQILCVLIASKGTKGVQFTSRHGLVAMILFLSVLGIFREHFSLYLLLGAMGLFLLYGSVVGNLYYDAVPMEKVKSRN